MNYPVFYVHFPYNLLRLNPILYPLEINYYLKMTYQIVEETKVPISRIYTLEEVHKKALELALQLKELKLHYFYDYGVYLD